MSTDSFERELRAMLDAHAEVEIPAPPVDMLTRGGSVVKTRRRLAVAVAGFAAAAAVIAAVAIPIATTHRSAPVEPSGPAGGVPYIQHGLLHLDGLSTPLRIPRPEGYADGGVAITASQPAKHRTFPTLTWNATYRVGNHLVTRPAPEAAQTASVTPTGEVIMTNERTDTSARDGQVSVIKAEAWDPRTNVVVDTATFTHANLVQGLDPLGRLAVSNDHGGTDIWTPGSAPTEVSGIPAEVQLVIVGGTWQLMSVSQTRWWTASVDSSGVAHRFQLIPLGTTGSPDGRSYIYTADTDGTPDAQSGVSTWVTGPDGSRHPLALPASAVAYAARFTDDTHVLLDAESVPNPAVTHKASLQVRPLGVYFCDITSGSCTLDLPTPKNSGIVALVLAG